jgi:hypothetical protein
MEVGELQLALRTLRTAASFIAPWNMSFTALENFLINSKFCREDLQGVDKPAALLSQFIDYVLMENANSGEIANLSCLAQSSKTHGTLSTVPARSPPLKRRNPSL